MSAYTDVDDDFNEDALSPFDAATDMVATGRKEPLEKALRQTPNLLTKTDKEGWSLLIWAASTGQPEIARFLIDKGAALNATTNDGATALMVAAEMEDKKIVQHLLQAGAAKNLKDDEGQTAVDYARKNGDEALATFIAGFVTAQDLTLKKDMPVHPLLKIKKRAP